VIVDGHGKEVYSAAYSDKIDVGSLASGIYYIRLLDSGKKIVSKKKIVVR
jgi:hypothetical protein